MADGIITFDVLTGSVAEKGEVCKPFRASLGTKLSVLQVISVKPEGLADVTEANGLTGGVIIHCRRKGPGTVTHKVLDLVTLQERNITFMIECS